MTSGKFVEELLHRGVPPGWVATADHGAVFWFEDQSDGRWRLIWNGSPGEPFAPGDSYPVVSTDDRRRVCYFGRRADSFFIGLDDKELPAFGGPLVAGSHASIPRFSPNGARLAYVVKVDDEAALLVDGDMVARGSIMSPVFSPDGSRLAYVEVETDRRRMRVVLDGVPGPWVWEIVLQEADFLGGVQFSPDGRRFAYCANDGKMWHWTVDGVPYPELAGTRAGMFSPDSRRFAYVGNHGAGAAVFVDGTAGPEYAEVESAFFTSDGNRLAFIARKNSRKAVVVVDGVEGSDYDDVPGAVTFSPDGARFAHFGVRKEGLLRQRRVYAVVDGQQGDWFDEASVDRVRFSPDSLRTIFTARRGKEWFVVTDGQAGQALQAAWWPSFGRSGKSFCAALLGGGFTVIVEGTPGPMIGGYATSEQVVGDAQVPYAVSPDGRHVACVGVDSGWGELPIVDDALGVRYDRVWSPFWQSDTVASFIASRGGEVYRILFMA